MASHSIDIGFTGGGSGNGVGMVYMAGKTDHKIDNAGMVDHIAGLVEKKAAELEVQKAAAEARDPILETIAAEGSLV